MSQRTRKERPHYLLVGTQLTTYAVQMRSRVGA